MPLLKMLELGDVAAVEQGASPAAGIRCDTTVSVFN
jgi:hypothetical protein